MTLYEQIIAVYPELTDADFGSFGTIMLRDDSDGQGAYIFTWEYSKPVPAGLKVGK
jgi:hypothetical protein